MTIDKINTEWEYSQTYRLHWICDGKMYQKTCRLWEIRNCTPYGMINQYYKQGYDLYHKGKFVQHGKTVKELKQIVENKANQ